MALMCPLCELRMEVDRLREEDEAAIMLRAMEGGTRCFINLKKDKTTITIYGEIDRNHLDALLNLLAHLNEYKLNAPSSTG